MDHSLKEIELVLYNMPEI